MFATYNAMQEINVDNKLYGRQFLIILVAVLIRWCVSLNSYSGENTPPMYGDYEAQRHWMEITYNLPVSEWYINSTQNDLLYWGLDYPPLTAYHSYLYGFIASIICPESVALHASRGYETDHHKLFMRYSVLLADILTFIPAVYIFFIVAAKDDPIKPDRFILGEKYIFSKWVYICLALYYPGIILIDYGHFQYNCISLGLYLMSVALLRRHEILSSFVFCLAFNYKQMELYHALPFFFYFLGKFFHNYRRRSATTAVRNLFIIVLVVLFAFILVWIPFISDSGLLLSVLKRIFPVTRGVFEDKVSNFWCIFNIIYKFRSKHSNETMFVSCLFLTAISLLPSVVNLFRRPTYNNFILSSIICSLSFYLFSFQVHEKSILLVAIPVILYLPANIFTSIWFLLISVFSMSPLLYKDKLFIPYVSLTVLYYLFFISFLNIKDNINKSKFNNSNNLLLKVFNFKVFLFYTSLIGCACLSIMPKLFKPPTHYPDLWPLLISFYSFIHFISFLLYFNYCQFLTPSAEVITN